MKKLFIISVAAIVALAACSKTEVKDLNSEKAISFQVAKYVGQTKADKDSHDHTSLIDEGFNTFKTNAYFYTPGKAVQAFMEDQVVSYDGSSKWAPTREYFWPKTGYINFFSYAGTIEPTAKAENSLTYTDATILPLAPASNILVADAAYGFNSNDNAEHKLNGVTEGVPTLFRHMLAKVVFDVIVDATEGTDDKYNWTATVNSATVSYRNQGSLSVAFTAPSSITGPSTVQGVPTWTPKDVANASLNKVSATVAPSAVGGDKTATPVTLIEESVVLPQTLNATGVTFAMEYDLTYTYNGGSPITETVPVTATALTTLAPSITNWAVNTVYKYHIIIKPNGPVLFDPAVETWAEVESADSELNF